MKPYDLAILGAGPAGLSGAVCAASDGLDTIVIAPHFGGQAHFSTHIENYLGFPEGITGDELTGRAMQQAKKFGVEFREDRAISMFQAADNTFGLLIAGGQQILFAKSVLLALGLSWNRDAVLEEHVGTLVHYAGTMTDVEKYRGKPVVVLGGGNSAGQAAVGFAKVASHVYLVSRKPLRNLMSDYLMTRIAGIKNITVMDDHRIGRVVPELNQVYIVGANSCAPGPTEVAAIFPYIGGRPNTDWLPESIQRNEHGFIVSGFSGSAYQTSMPGVFVAGDIRAGSEKRVASAVGSGGCAVNEIDRFLKPPTLIENI